MISMCNCVLQKLDKAHICVLQKNFCLFSVYYIALYMQVLCITNRALEDICCDLSTA